MGKLDLHSKEGPKMWEHNLGEIIELNMKKNQCFNCFRYGHEVDECPIPIRADYNSHQHKQERRGSKGGRRNNAKRYEAKRLHERCGYRTSRSRSKERRKMRKEEGK